MPTLSASPYSARIKNLQAGIKDRSLTALFLSRPADIAYYTGFQFLLSEEREAFLLIGDSIAKLWYASFSPLPNNIACETIPMRSVAEVAQQVAQLQLSTIALDPFSITLAEQRMLAQSNTSLTDLDRQIIWQQRAIKDNNELELITKASQITLQAFTAIVPKISTGLTEQDVAMLLDAQIRTLGAEPAFPTIVAFGNHTALPHHQPTQTKLSRETAILIDFGAKYQSYCSDFTRSWWFGTKPPITYQAISSAVRHAYQAGEHALSQSLTAQDLDAIVRTDIEQAGYGSAFIHTTGHGLGLEIHEPPSLSARNSQTLHANMALTIEPGIYLEGQFGYRHENTIILTNSKPIVTTPHNAVL